MPENQETTLNDIKKRLDILISLEVKKEMKDNKVTSRDVIANLSSMDLKYTEIANIIGKSPSYVASEQTLLKKKNKDMKVSDDGQGTI